jgi:hypothetical protein
MWDFKRKQIDSYQEELAKSKKYKAIFTFLDSQLNSAPALLIQDNSKVGLKSVS